MPELSDPLGYQRWWILVLGTTFCALAPFVYMDFFPIHKKLRPLCKIVVCAAGVFPLGAVIVLYVKRALEYGYVEAAA